MNDEEEIITYTRNLVRANFMQYLDESPGLVMNIKYDIDNDSNNECLLQHLERIKSLIETSIRIIKKKQKEKTYE